MKFCIGCGVKISSKAKYCPECGKKQEFIVKDDFSKHLRTFINFYFAIILGLSFTTLFERFLLIANYGSIVSLVLFIIFFVTTYFFLVTDWIYHGLLMEDFPYKSRFGRFFDDLIIFSIMYLLIYSSFYVSDNAMYFLIYVILLGTWHFAALIWHLLARRQYEDKKKIIKPSIEAHSIRSYTYFIIALVFYFGRMWLPVNWITYILMSFVIGLIWFFNITRLLFLIKKRELAPNLNLTIL